jgi:hypothetical protein
MSIKHTKENEMNDKSAITRAITAAMFAGLTAASLCLATPARADVFDICPSGHEGVVGGHTTCGFAYNVGRGFDACGGCHHFPAYSPGTGERYDMDCEGMYPAYFSDGQTLNSTRCYAGENAEVVLW